MERFQRAIALLDAGEPATALQEFEAFSAETGDPLEKGSLILHQATCLWRLGRLKEARGRLSEAQRLWSNRYTDFLDARLCVWEGRKDEALTKLILFLERHPDLKLSDDQDLYVDTLEELGRLLIDLGRSLDAVPRLEEALRLAQGDQRRRLLHYLGICDFDKANWEAAEKRFIQSLAAGPAGPCRRQTHYYLGVCHLETKKLDMAEQALTRSLPDDRQDPLWALAQFQVGRVYFLRGEYVSAKTAFELSDFFSERADVKKDIAKWLAATRLRLGEHGELLKPH